MGGSNRTDVQLSDPLRAIHYKCGLYSNEQYQHIIVVLMLINFQIGNILTSLPIRENRERKCSKINESSGNKMMRVWQCVCV